MNARCGLLLIALLCGLCDPTRADLHPDPPCKGPHDWSCVAVRVPCCKVRDTEQGCPSPGEYTSTLCVCKGCGKSTHDRSACQ